MDRAYNIFDTVQLIIPSACLIFLIGIIITYFFLYMRFRTRLYLCVLVFGICASFYILCETMVIVSGWQNWISFGRYMHRTGQLLGFFFCPILAFFAHSLLEKRKGLKLGISIALYIGLAASIIGVVLAFIIPDSFISIAKDISREIVSPGDIARGAKGFLYTIRDLVLAIYLIGFTIFGVISLLDNPSDKRTLYIFIGVVLSLITAVDDMLYIQIGRNFMLNSLRFSRVSVGLTAMIFFFAAALLTEFLRTHNLLSEAHESLYNAHKAIQKSEKKYRVLTEGADQAIFSLSPNMDFLSYNDKAKNFFALHEDEKKLFHDVMDNIGSNGTALFTKELLEENFDSLRDGKSISFNSVISDPRTGEPEEYEFHFDYFEHDEVEFIGRAQKRKRNRFVKYIDYEKLRLSIENYIIMIDDISSRLTAALERTLDMSETLQIKIGLQETLVNAIEHGNLGISFDEKSKALNEGKYMDLIRERQKDPIYRKRKVTVDYILGENSVKYLITDEGDGFDFEKTMAKIKKKVNSELLPHGRGINMTSVIFDEVKYNSKGNQVLLTKKLN